MTQTRKEPTCAWIYVVDMCDFNLGYRFFILIRFIAIDTRSNEM